MPSVVSTTKWMSPCVTSSPGRATWPSSAMISPPTVSASSVSNSRS